MAFCSLGDGKKGTIPDIRIKFQDKNLTVLNNLEDIIWGGEGGGRKTKLCYFLSKIQNK